MDHFKTSIEINRPDEIVFRAISKRLGFWWGKQDQLIDQVGVVFTVSWNEPWYQFKVIRYIENQEMVWECMDANQIIDGLDDVQKEWVGTKIHWRIINIGKNRTLLEFEHEGLAPEFICFRFCSDSWNHFLNESLVAYLKRCNSLDEFL
ncbi:MAG: hypothetical protein AAF391_05355 [Bacteroidota bacterium]